MDIDNTLFARLGGIRAMADLVGEAPSTVQSWKTAGRIPAQKQPVVIERAVAAGFAVTAHDVVFPMGVDQEHGEDDIGAGVDASTGKESEISGQAVGA